MSTIRTIPVGVIDPATNYEQQVPVVAEVVKIVSNSNPGYSLVGLRDFDGTDFVALIRGRGKPTAANIGQVSVFMLAGKAGPKGTQYSGFYNPKDAIPQQYIGKRPPAPAGGQSTGSNTGGSTSSCCGSKSGSQRGFALSYAKDLVVAGAITVKQLPGVTRKFNTYLDTGTWPLVEDPRQTVQPIQQAPSVEQEIPEQGEAPYGYDQTQSLPVQQTLGQVQQPQQSEFEQQYAKPGEEDVPF